MSRFGEKTYNTLQVDWGHVAAAGEREARKEWERMRCGDYKKRHLKRCPENA